MYPGLLQVLWIFLSCNVPLSSFISTGFLVQISDKKNNNKTFFFMCNIRKGEGLCWGWSPFKLFFLHCLFSTTINSWLYMYVVIMSRTWFESESTLYSCLNVKDLLAWYRRNIWSLSDRNGIRTHNHSVRKCW